MSAETIATIIQSAVHEDFGLTINQLASIRAEDLTAMLNAYSDADGNRTHQINIQRTITERVLWDLKPNSGDGSFRAEVFSNAANGSTEQRITASSALHHANDPDIVPLAVTLMERADPTDKALGKALVAMHCKGDTDLVLYCSTSNQQDIVEFSCELMKKAPHWMYTWRLVELTQQPIIPVRQAAADAKAQLAVALQKTGYSIEDALFDIEVDYLDVFDSLDDVWDNKAEYQVGEHGRKLHAVAVLWSYGEAALSPLYDEAGRGNPRAFMTLGLIGVSAADFIVEQGNIGDHKNTNGMHAVDVRVLAAVERYYPGVLSTVDPGSSPYTPHFINKAIEMSVTRDVLMFP